MRHQQKTKHQKRKRKKKKHLEKQETKRTQGKSRTTILQIGFMLPPPPTPTPTSLNHTNPPPLPPSPPHPFPSFTAARIYYGDALRLILQNPKSRGRLAGNLSRQMTLLAPRRGGHERGIFPSVRGIDGAVLPCSA